MTKKYSLNILLNGEIIEDNLEISYNQNGKCQCVYSCENFSYAAENTYPFFALVQIREDLERVGAKILCNGSRRDVYPSGMSSIGTLAYVLEMGKQATKLVEIFEPCQDLDKIVAVSEQNKFWNSWLKSL